MSRTRRTPSLVLRLAGVYNLIWGALVIGLPHSTLGWLLGAERVREIDPITLVLWQCIGMIVGVYGVGYWITARDAVRYWPIVLVGLLGKVLGPIGFAGGLITGTVPLSFGVTIVPNDLIWWIPFWLLLRQARGASRSTPESATPSAEAPND